ncbi:hypothetical protein FOMG_18203 [Fusarium oxysporum f. sp. melonis 26406]|uniref:HNH nuclease domain-containing protein n=1 Tax=Fusarium oxysporum f. sp. melonis 26406 TaxID=1089452 RepID=W9ZA39_FUSOX|nr:hypothetical protein FOMG_18203 [Fusarium oxysporum f. sp. melonis 26406]
MSVDSDDDKFSLEESNRRLKEAWQSTWNPRNGILLMKNLHEFFDARLFSIHPYTHRIRVFVPYDALTKFNGKKASVHTTIDRKALRHHYTMSCIENMAAGRPILDVISPSTSRMASGKATPLTARTDLPATPTSVSRATEWWATRLRDSDGTIPTKADKETFRCKDKWLQLDSPNEPDFLEVVEQKLEEIKGNGSFNAGLGATFGQ